MEAMEPLRGESVTLRRATIDDAMRLTEILAHPYVAAWWGPHDLAAVQDKVSGHGDGSTPFVVEAAGEVIGLIQYSEENEPSYRHAGIDIFLHPDWHGRGLGVDALRTLARYLFEEREHHRITIDPAAHNERAIRSYQRVGFRPVGVMRQYERGPDGDWHDGLLMDLLRDELT
jgi:aminoglycoside 6'-N-acetyltransferase